MTPVRPKPARKRPLVVTERMEAILKAVHFYRYMTVLDVTHLLYSPTSHTYVRSMLADLAGGKDGQTNNYLYRFRLPKATEGNAERIYTLGSRGRDYLQQLGLPVDWYFRPHKMMHMGYSHLLHSVILTRFLVAGCVWTSKQSVFRLNAMHICYELGKEPATVTITQGGAKKSLKVIPDAWLDFRHLKTGKRFPILLEIDRGTEYQQKFKQHVASRIAFVQSGMYQKLFKVEAVAIAYATTGITSAQRETRRITMCKWTTELLEELGMPEWSSIFRFHSLALNDIYNTPLFDERTWYIPGIIEPVTLLVR